MIDRVERKKCAPALRKVMPHRQSQDSSCSAHHHHAKSVLLSMTPHAKCTFYGHDSQRELKQKAAEPHRLNECAFTFNVINASSGGRRKRISRAISLDNERPPKEDNSNDEDHDAASIFARVEEICKRVCKLKSSVGAHSSCLMFMFSDNSAMQIIVYFFFFNT